jgi:pyrimidine-nucleoside phosphorylase
MRFIDVIAQKRDGGALSREAIDAFVQGATNGTVPDYQLAALLMAIVWRGMTAVETSWLTDAMVRSGDRVDLSDVDGATVGKHSTGGVGDKVSIVLAPVAAACGVVVPKMSGRGLGHTGGTLDKLESIPGYRVALSVEEFKRVLRAVGASIIGQSASLVPADKVLYGLRDVTATVASVPLIAASIMSKKLAEGSRALVLDVKCGDGAFMTIEAHARELASAMVAIGNAAGVRTEAFMTDMNTPLGRTVGNALEIAECVEVLRGGGPSDLQSVVRTLAARMVTLAGRRPDDASALAAVDAALASGAALDVFRRMVEAHGGDPRAVDDLSRLPHVDTVAVVRASRPGAVGAVRAGAIGWAAHALGAGRTAAGESVDPAVGVRVVAQPGSVVVAGDVLAELHHRDGRGLAQATALCEGAFVIGDEAAPMRPRVLSEVR